MCAVNSGIKTASLTCMRFLLLYIGIVLQPYIIINIKVEQRTALSPGLGDDQVIEGEVVRQYQIFLHVHQVTY